MLAILSHRRFVQALSQPHTDFVRRLSASSADGWARFSGHAKFIAGAETTESVPKLAGLPEVIFRIHEAWTGR